MISEFLARFGIAIENRNRPRSDVTRVESAVAVSRIFNHDAASTPEA